MWPIPAGDGERDACPGGLHSGGARMSIAAAILASSFRWPPSRPPVDTRKTSSSLEATQSRGERKMRTEESVTSRRLRGGEQVEGGECDWRNEP